MKLLSVDRRESQETPEQTLARLHDGSHTATPVDHGPAKPSEGFGQRLARIPQRRWRLICLAFWLCAFVLAAIVAGFIGAFWPDSTPDEAWGVGVIAVLVPATAFWGVGATRTAHIDPYEWTAIQRVSKYVSDHPGA